MSGWSRSTEGEAAREYRLEAGDQCLNKTPGIRLVTDLNPLRNKRLLLSDAVEASSTANSPYTSSHIQRNPLAAAI